MEVKTTEELIKYLVKEKGLSVQKVAVKLGKSPQSLGRSINTGKLQVAELKDVLDTLGEQLIIELSDGKKIEVNG